MERHPLYTHIRILESQIEFHNQAILNCIRLISDFNKNLIENPDHEHIWTRDSGVIPTYICQYCGVEQ